jgi:spermidine synthase
VLVSGALLDMAVGVVLLFSLARSSAGVRPLALAALAGWVIVAAGCALSPAFDRSLLLSGVYRYGAVPARGSREILYYRDGRTATVSAERIKATGETFIATNGKSDGALPAYWFKACDDTAPRLPLRADAATFTLSALIALAHRPEARTAAVIGQGTGMSGHLLLGSPGLKDLYTIEIEPEMIRASRAFYPANRRVFDDPRSHYVVDDAKSYFAAAGRRYDLIFSEPSQPWVSGVAGLFTEEFYGQVARYLEPDGVFAQWIHLYDIDDRLVLTVLAALQRQFRDYEVFMPTVTDMLVVATNAGAVPRPDWSVFQLPGIAKDLCHQILFTAEALEATRLGNRTSLGPLVEAHPQVNSDFLPLLDLGAERARFMGREATGIYGLSAERFDITAPFTGRRIGPASFTHAPAPDVPRMYGLALGATLRDPRSYLSSDPGPGDEGRAAALFRDRAWRALVASPDPPTSWRIWLQHLATVEADRYGGTSGYADPSFYQELSRYLDRHRAPPEARAAVEFRRALSAWDFEAAIRAADPLIAATRSRRGWVPADELLDGVTVARLASGDGPGAREIFARLVPFSRRSITDFRTALLASYLDRWRGK